MKSKKIINSKSPNFNKYIRMPKFGYLRYFYFIVNILINRLSNHYN